MAGLAYNNIHSNNWTGQPEKNKGKGERGCSAKNQRKVNPLRESEVVIVT